MSQDREAARYDRWRFSHHLFLFETGVSESFNNLAYIEEKE
jgi:hypothetical protein